MLYRTKDQLEAATAAGTKSSYTVGVDLGQSVDPTAIAVIERIDIPHREIRNGWPTGAVKTETTFAVRHLERLPLQTTYPAVVDHIAAMLATAPLSAGADLVIDRTGVGRGPHDMMVEAGLNPIGVTITAGDGFSRDGTDFRVSKLELVSTMTAAFHRGDLHIAKSLPEAKALVEELHNFRVNFSSAGNMKFGAREGRHDDLVLATAIAIWHARQRDGARLKTHSLGGF